MSSQQSAVADAAGDTAALTVYVISWQREWAAGSSMTMRAISRRLDRLDSNRPVADRRVVNMEREADESVADAIGRWCEAHPDEPPPVDDYNTLIIMRQWWPPPAQSGRGMPRAASSMNSGDRFL